jgi:hypothetical protein
MRRTALSLLLLFAAGEALAGSNAVVGITPPSSLETPSRDPGCRDFKRRPVRMVEVPFLGDAGRAEMAGGGPVIKIDPDIMRALPGGLQQFFQLHECAHHALGHLFAPTLDSEKEADCWAMKEGVRRKAFVIADLEAWRPYFERSRGSAMHLPGPQRVAFLANCVDGQ